jgi:preprotein translocase subunit SecE
LSETRVKGTAAASAADERPERRKVSAEGGAIASITGWPKKTKDFLGDVRTETRRVTWPTRSQVRATTIVVIVTVFFFGSYIGILDWLYTRAVGWLLRWGG